MRITIILPTLPRQPSGGHRVIYEHANRLTGRGHAVTIVHPLCLSRHRRMPHRARAFLWGHRMRFAKDVVPWFRIDPNVRSLVVTKFTERNIPDGDIVLATAWQTAEFVRRLPERTGVKCYFVQDYEYWITAQAEVRARIAETFKADLRMIAVSSAVQDMIRSYGEIETAIVHSGVDSAVYRPVMPIDHRPRSAVGFPVRDDPRKGTADAIAACELLRARWGSALKVSAFGATAPAALPEWIQFLQFPSDHEVARFYNQLSVFLFPSHYEGWGLPGIEALACATPLVAADSVGIRDFARNGETALVVDRAKPALLAQAVDALLTDERLRRRLALNGHREASKYTWERASAQLERVLADQLP